MTRQDWLFFCAGPLAILLIWTLLPRGRSEAWRAGDAASAGAVAELVGYAFEATSPAPVLIGRSAEAGFRLHGAPVAPRAAWLTPPGEGSDLWTIVPAQAGLTLKLLDPSSPREANKPPSKGGTGRVMETSVRPWREPGRGTSRLLPGWRPRAEPIEIRCGDRVATVTPFRLRDAGALAGAWGARVSVDGDQRTLLPWSTSSGPRGLWLAMSGPQPRSIEIGIAAEVRCQVDPREAGAAAAAIGPLSLSDGDLLAIGRTRFLVQTADPRRLELYHARDPESPGYFSASAGHDAYHPNRRALWGVPPCGRQEGLTLVVEPRQALSDSRASAADLPLDDRRLQSQIRAAIRDHGVPHELAVVAPEQVSGGSLLSLCTVDDDRGQLGVRLVAARRGRAKATPAANGIVLRTGLDGDPEPLTEEERTVPIETRRWLLSRDPAELLLDLEGNLLRVAPISGPRITRRARAGLAGYLIFVLVLQAWPLTRARTLRRVRPDRWPAALATPSLQQAAGIAITSLLFLGASFHLFLGLHPELVGKPDYLQAFLQGTVAVCVVLAAAAGFSHPHVGLEQRSASAALYAAATLLAAAGWWWLDAAGSARGAWLTAWRDLSSAAAGASPEAMGRRLFSAGGLCAAAAVVLFAAARLRWSRATEHLGRFAVRFPFAGFIALAVAGLGLGMLQRSALAFELALLAGLAWFAAVYWAFVRHGRLTRDDALRRKAAATSMASGLLMLLFLAVFFIVGADLPDAVSFASVVLGLGVLGAALRIARDEQSTSLLRVVSLWAPAAILGVAFASFVLTDMGSVAAWMPALATGFFLWLVRPEEVENRLEEPRKARSHLLLALGSGLVLLGLLDVFKRIVEGLDWRILERPQQRLALAEDISYITSGEWITQVRWLASQQEDSLHWVPNANSDVAIFGLAANLGFGWAVAASLVLLAIAGCAALAADQALRAARDDVRTSGGDRLRPALFRTLGLTLGMVCVLLISQWLVHLATGVVLHLPITGLVFPWISHGNTTHLLYAAAVLLPMAAINALDGSRRR